MSRPRIITLTTDFGAKDAYVGVVKGVILSIAPDTRLVDITHEVQPQAVAEAAFHLLVAYRYFPADAIHVAVVDPGVGTARRAVAVLTQHGTFVGPDNGIFSRVLADGNAIDPGSGRLIGARAFELVNPEYRLPAVSTTFHGRDIFAPAAAHLASGVEPAGLGPPLSHLVALPGGRPSLGDGEISGTIVHIDRFGNAISNIDGAHVPAGATVEVGGRVAAIASTYQEADVVALVGSSGLLEVAVRNGSAADALGIRVGHTILVRGPH